jgi:hypothetical protein
VVAVRVVAVRLVRVRLVDVGVRAVTVRPPCCDVVVHGCVAAIVCSSAGDRVALIRLLTAYFDATSDCAGVASWVSICARNVTPGRRLTAECEGVAHICPGTDQQRPFILRLHEVCAQACPFVGTGDQRGSAREHWWRRR